MRSILLAIPLVLIATIARADPSVADLTRAYSMCYQLAVTGYISSRVPGVFTVIYQPDVQAPCSQIDQTWQTALFSGSPPDLAPLANPVTELDPNFLRTVSGVQ